MLDDAIDLLPPAKLHRLQWDKVLPAWFKALSATAPPEEYATRNPAPHALIPSVAEGLRRDRFSGIWYRDTPLGRVAFGCSATAWPSGTPPA